jgi:hypothetical protein
MILWRGQKQTLVVATKRKSRTDVTIQAQETPLDQQKVKEVSS